MHICDLSALIRACEILIRSLEPANIVVAVRYQMHVKMFVLRGEMFLTLIVPFVGMLEFFFFRDIIGEGHLCEASNQGKLSQSSLHFLFYLL